MLPSFAICSNFSFTIFMHLHGRMTFPFLGTSNGLSRFCKRSTTASRHQICWNLLCCFVLRKNWARCASVEITYPELNIKDDAELFSNFLYLSKQQKLCNQKHFIRHADFMKFTVLSISQYLFVNRASCCPCHSFCLMKVNKTIDTAYILELDHN